MKKNVMLVGGFHKARSLASSLLNKGYRVTIVNNNYKHCVMLTEMSGVVVIFGDGTKPFVLEDAVASEMDIVIALTQRDDDNLVICELCKKKYNVKKAVALVNDARKTEFFHQMGVDSVVSATSAIAGIIEQQAFMDEVATVIPISEGRISIAEIPINQNSSISGMKLMDMKLPKEVIVGCILRNDRNIIPQGNTRVIEGDVLVVISADKEKMESVKELMGTK